MDDDSCALPQRPLPQPMPAGPGDPTHGPWADTAAYLSSLRRFVESQWHGLDEDTAARVTSAAPQSIRQLCLHLAWRETFG